MMNVHHEGVRPVLITGGAEGDQVYDKAVAIEDVELQVHELVYLSNRIHRVAEDDEHVHVGVLAGVASGVRAEEHGADEASPVARGKGPVRFPERVVHGWGESGHAGKVQRVSCVHRDGGITPARWR
jgi:hypothetical protein